MIEAPAPAKPWLDYLAAAERLLGETRGAALRHRIAIAGQVIDLHFAGPALRDRLFRALAHRETDAGATAPDLAITLTDAATAGVALPFPPFGERRVARGQLVEAGARHFAAYEEATAALSLLDRSRAVAWYHVPDARRLPSFETAFPLRALFNAWLGPHGIQLLHAGAVGTADGAVLLAGAGGAGKSNTCLGCLDAGLRYAGDDYVAVTASGTPVVHGLYASAKLFASDVARFPRLARCVSDRGKDDVKAVLLLHPECITSLAPAMPVRAILLPRVGSGSRSRLVPVSRARSLAALAPSTLFQLAGARDRELATLRRVAASVPSHVLELGSDRAAIPPLIAGLLRELTSTAASCGAAAS